MILQQVKNNKLTRNTPIIVLSIEADSEKVYLLGSVDYLVKPINYNNLIEILTSYKLRRNSTVLCVDDDKPTLNLINQAVRTAGFNALSFYRPELVIESISDKDIDLAIIDLDMPIMDGFDLILEIKSLEKFSKLPIIIYTGQEDYHKNLIKIDGMFVDLLKKRSTSINELENRITDMIKSYEQPLKPDENLDSSNVPKILMAEDYKHSQIIVTRLLKKSGFENIIVVENGEEALNICENDKIDLILMDMQMPVMNGFEATGKIRKLPGYADTPIISLTAFAMKGDREKCLEAGATDYIPKPIDSKEFIEKVIYYTQVAVSE
jgi:CheY-like chemotaxis protein